MRRLFPGDRKFRTDPPIRIFQQNWLEALTLTPFSVFFTVWCVALAAVFWFAGMHAESLPSLLGWSALGFVAWFPLEYLAHRFPFHWASDAPAVKKFVYIIHGNHHLQPNHPLRTLMPFSVTAPIALLLGYLAIHWLGMARGSGVWAGFLLGYVYYDVVHYACHNWPMKRGFGRWVRRHHLLHHYGDEDTNYQISFPPIDYLCRSQFRKKSSAAARRNEARES